MANGIVLNIDTTKSEFQNPMVQLRQGDGNYQSLSVTVTSNGEPLDLTGWTVTFMGTTAGGFKIVDSAVTVTNALQGEFTYTPTKAWGQDQGEFKNAYFKFTKAEETASGASFRVNVLEEVDLTAEEAGDYISIVDVTINKLTGDLSKLQRSVDDLKSQNNAIKTTDNTWSGTNTFNKLINGALKTREATFTDFADVAADMINYAGFWRVGSEITNAPQPGIGSCLVEVIPSTTTTNGSIRVIGYVSKVIYNATVTASTLSWQVVADDTKVIHNTGTETIAGDKTFTGTNTFNKKIIAQAGVQGNADTATKLQTPHKINGTIFDNTQDVTVYRVNDSDITLNTGFEKFETDKAHYHPLELVEFLFKPKANAGNLAITYYKRNELVATQHIAYDSQTVQWHWRLPEDDIEAYIVKVVNTVKGQSETFYHAINVSWNQKDRPLMGFLSKFGDYNLENVNNIMTYLKRLHINYIQYYDWFDRHDVPIKSDDDNGFVSHYWGDFVNRPSRFDMIHKYIEMGNKYGMLNMLYGLINGASQNKEQNGLTKEMYMFDDASGDLNKVTNSDLTPWAKYVLYQMNFMQESYKDHTTKEYAKIYKYLPFDGWHIDTLGDPGSKYASDGKNFTSVTWKVAYPFFIDAAIDNSNGKRAGLNAVAEYGQKEIATSKADYIYTEVWDNRKTYNDMMNMIIEMRNLSDKELIVAGYMHHHWSNNNDNNTNLVFNDPAVILTDLVIMASGATHLEMGEHMLTTEYFPNNKLSMSDALKDYLVKIYDLQVAFKRLFKI